MNPLVLWGIKVALVPVVGLASAWVVGHMRAVNVHTKNARLDAIIDTAGNIGEDLVKVVLTSGDLQALASAVAGGTPLGDAIAHMQPALVGQVQEGLGPVLTKELTGILGDSAAKRLAQVVVGATHDLIEAKRASGNPPLALPGQIVKLASGHMLVVPHGQPLPAGSTLVATNGSPAAAAA